MSERITDIVERVRRFMESDVYPLEEHTNGEPFYTILPLLEQKRVRVKELGPVSYTHLTLPTICSV